MANQLWQGPDSARLPDPLEYRHTVHCIGAGKRCVADHFASTSQAAIPSFEVSRAKVRVHLSEILFQEWNEQSQITREVDRSRNVCSKDGVYVGELTEIEFCVAERAYLLPEPTCRLSKFYLHGRTKVAVRSTILSATGNNLLFKLGQTIFCLMQRVDVDSGEYRAYPLTHEITSNCGAQQGCQQTQHSSYTRPRVPVNRACLAEAPALTYPVPHTHSVSPLLTGQHSAMGTQ